MRLAVERLSVRLMSWLHKNCPPASVELTPVEIAYFGHLAVVKCLFHRKYKFSYWALAVSASRDELMVAQFLYKHRHALGWTSIATSRAIDTAAMDG